MKKIYDSEMVETCLKKTKYAAEMSGLQDCLFITQYEKGEFVTSPLQTELLFQIVICGAINIYFIRDDGSAYSLADGRNDYLLGETEIFSSPKGNVYAEAKEDLTCLALSIEKCREKLMTNCLFLQLICKSLAQKMEVMITLDAAPATLKQRVLTYMKYKCNGWELKGLEQAAFHLNCSTRQLQRILNQYEEEHIVQKTGKGNYKLLHHSFPLSEK